MMGDAVLVDFFRFVAAIVAVLVVTAIVAALVRDWMRHR